MSNLDFQNSIKNFAKEIRPDIEKEPFFNRFMEIYLEEALTVSIKKIRPDITKHYSLKTSKPTKDYIYYY